MAGSLFQKNQTNMAGNQFQTCSDIFCEEIHLYENWDKKNQPNTAGKNTSLVFEPLVPIQFSNLSMSRTKQSWRTMKIIGLKVPEHG